ncbi:CapA family protein [Paenibacillus sp. JCM 10914]|uniref:CapA family protein n=1 Tax=Paenibacillus sp. JCM 10914 TaxID=1236974 RepID=UPI0003CC9500|nr:CapA family protein [Paenibacillus sp. JCM 10914]GAE09253.1 capsule biosynthesis protein, putative [Paenibacillus sp. JCM 10914]
MERVLSLVLACCLILPVPGVSAATSIGKETQVNANKGAVAASAKPTSEKPNTDKAKPKSTKPIELIFVGDILLDGFVGNQIARYGNKFPFEKVAPILKKADMAFANLETPVSERGTKANKTFAFRSKPETLEGLTYAGIDGVTLANNHILDYGPKAMLDTLTHLKRNGIGYTGAGRDIDEAFKPYVQTIEGKKIAVLGVSRVLSDTSWIAGKDHPGAASAYTMEPMISHIKQSAKNNDYTIVYIHWNQEFADYPEDYARAMAKKMIDAGADIIIGSHSHTLMGIEYYKNKPIYYSLGNFVFNRSTRGGDKTLLSMMVHVEIKGSSIKSKVTPVKIIGGQPNLMNNNYNQNIIAMLNKFSYNAKIDSKGNVTQKK